MVPVATAASTGIDFISPAWCYFWYFPYIKYKSYKTSSTNMPFGQVENFGKRPAVTGLAADPSCEKSILAAVLGTLEKLLLTKFDRRLHSFHTLPTEQGEEEVSVPWKTRKRSRLSAQLLGQFVEQPV
jgi:hypothetical protein